MAAVSLLILFTGRASAVLHYLLPPELSKHLPPIDLPPDRETLLLALSSGQLLCVAYNTGVRRSKKPWGYINKPAIHDIAALEAEAQTKGAQAEANGKKRAWTFRRTENLRLWAACVPVTPSILIDSLRSLQRPQIAVHALTRLKFPTQWYILTIKYSSPFTGSSYHRFPSTGTASAIRRTYSRKARGALGGHAGNRTIQVGRSGRQRKAGRIGCQQPACTLLCSFCLSLGQLLANLTLPSLFTWLRYAFHYYRWRTEIPHPQYRYLLAHN